MHIGLRDGFHQFADLGFQIVVRNDQRADGRAHVATACVDRLIDGGLTFAVNRAGIAGGNFV